MNLGTWSPGILEQTSLTLAEQAVQNGGVAFQMVHVEYWDVQCHGLILLVRCVRALAHKVQHHENTMHGANSKPSNRKSHALNLTKSTFMKSDCERDFKYAKSLHIREIYQSLVNGKQHLFGITYQEPVKLSLPVSTKTSMFSILLAILATQARFIGLKMASYLCNS